MIKVSTCKQGVPDVSSQQRAVNALTKLERKLRWIGMAEQAREIERQLSRRRECQAAAPGQAIADRLDGRG